MSEELPLEFLAKMIFPFAKVPVDTYEEFVEFMNNPPEISNDKLDVRTSGIINEEDDLRWRLNILISKINPDSVYHCILEMKNNEASGMFILSYVGGKTKFKSVVSKEGVLPVEEYCKWMILADEYVAPEVNPSADVAIP